MQKTTICITDDHKIVAEGTKKVRESVCSIIEFKDPELFEKELKLICDKRNNLVHRGLDVEITREDLYLIKILLQHLILFFVEHKDELNYEDFRFIQEHGRKNKNELIGFKKERKREIELIEKIIELKYNNNS